jgi:hypothetical protein
MKSNFVMIITTTTTTTIVVASVNICLIFGFCKDATSTSWLAMTSQQTDMEVNLYELF